MRKDSILQNFYNSKLPKAEKGKEVRTPVEPYHPITNPSGYKGKVNLNRIMSDAKKTPDKKPIEKVKQKAIADETYLPKPKIFPSKPIIDNGFRAPYEPQPYINYPWKHYETLPEIVIQAKTKKKYKNLPNIDVSSKKTPVIKQAVESSAIQQYNPFTKKITSTANPGQTKSQINQSTSNIQGDTLKDMARDITAVTQFIPWAPVSIPSAIINSGIGFTDMEEAKKKGDVLNENINGTGALPWQYMIPGPVGKGIEVISAAADLTDNFGLEQKNGGITKYMDGGLLSKTVTCSNCGHSWKGVDGGEDVMTCHKCGGMIKMKDGGELTPEELASLNRAKMRSKMALASEFGNPSAKRMTSVFPSNYRFSGNEMIGGEPVGVRPGETGTHFMSSMGNYAVPFIQQDANNKMIFNPNASFRDREAIRFDNPEDAQYFAEHYKDVAPMMMGFKKQGGQNMFAYGGPLADYYKGKMTGPSIFDIGGESVNDCPDGQIKVDGRCVDKTEDIGEEASLETFVETEPYVETLPGVTIKAKKVTPKHRSLLSYINPLNWGLHDYSNSSTFQRAYRKAKDAGDRNFMYGSNRYSTAYAGTPAQEMEQYGITADQRVFNPSQTRLNLGNLNTTAGYDTDLSDVFNTALTGKNKKGFFDDVVKKEHDAFRLYLGLPQEQNSFKPSTFKEGAYEIIDYDKNFPEVLSKRIEDLIINSGGSEEESKSDEHIAGKRSMIKPWGDIVMGKHTVKRGKDEKGDYIEYIDNWDLDSYKLNPVGDLHVPVGGAADVFNKPFPIYGRIYYKKDDKGRLIRSDLDPKNVKDDNFINREQLKKILDDESNQEQKFGGLVKAKDGLQINEPCPDGQVRVNGQCMPKEEAEAFRQRQYEQNPNIFWEEIAPGEYKSVTQMTPVTITSKPKYGTVTQDLGNGVSFDYAANLKNQTPVSKIWDFTLPAKGQLNAQNAKWKSYLPGVYNQPLYTPPALTTNIGGVNVPLQEQPQLKASVSTPQLLTPEAKERLKYLEAWYGKPKQKSNWELALQNYDKHTDSKEVNDAATDLRNQYYNNIILNSNSARNQANTITMGSAVAGAAATLPLIWGAAASSPLVTATGTALQTPIASVPGLTGSNLLGAYFFNQGAKNIPKVVNSWQDVINDPTWGKIGNATGETVITALDMLPFLHGASKGIPSVMQDVNQASKWLQGYKKVPTPTNSSSYPSFKSITGNPEYIDQEYLSELIKRETDWLRSKEYIKRKMTATGKSEEAIRKESEKIINNINNTSIEYTGKGEDWASGLYSPNVTGKNPKISIFNGDVDYPFYEGVLRHEVGHSFSEMGNPSDDLIRFFKNEGYRNYPKVNLNKTVGDRVSSMFGQNWSNLAPEQQVTGRRMMDIIEETQGLKRGTELTEDNVKGLIDHLKKGERWETSGDADVLTVLSDYKRKFGDSYSKQLTDFLNKAYVIPGIGVGAAATYQAEQKKQGGVTSNQGYYNVGMGVPRFDDGGPGPGDGVLPPIYTNNPKLVKAYKDSSDAFLKSADVIKRTNNLVKSGKTSTFTNIKVPMFFNNGTKIIPSKEVVKYIKSNKVKTKDFIKNVNSKRRAEVLSLISKNNIQPTSIYLYDTDSSYYDKNGNLIPGLDGKTRQFTPEFPMPVQPYILGNPPETKLKANSFVPATKIPMGQPSTGMQIQQRTFPKLDIPPMQQGHYRVEYFDPELKQETHRLFPTQEASDAFAKELSGRNLSGVPAAGNITQRYEQRYGGDVSLPQLPRKNGPLLQFYYSKFGGQR